MESMKLYSDFPAARSTQITSDVVAAVAITLSIVAAATVHATVVAFADFGRRLEGSGDDFRATMADAADRLSDVPLVGDGIRSPFEQASAAGQALAAAGRGQQELAETTAFVLAVLVALVPIALILRVWLLRRIRFARAAGVAATLARSEAGIDVLAFRALSARDPKTLFAVHPSPVDAWRHGDRVVVNALADLALRDAGVRSPGSSIRGGLS
ncbi:MAG: hypothetical protein RI885_2134 [Actinomycetota bacterium]|jgi:hypothetical protein